MRRRAKLIGMQRKMINITALHQYAAPSSGACMSRLVRSPHLMAFGGAECAHELARLVTPEAGYVVAHFAPLSLEFDPDERTLAITQRGRKGESDCAGTSSATKGLVREKTKWRLRAKHCSKCPLRTT